MNSLEKQTLSKKKRKEYQRQWRLRNKERLSKRGNERYQEHKEEILAHQKHRHEIKKNDPKYLEDRRVYAVKRRQKQRLWMNEIKKKLKCSKCGESRTVCLDFHHTNPEEKEFNLAWCFGTTTGSKEKILKEISKCIVLCANCHRIEHQNEQFRKTSS